VTVSNKEDYISFFITNKNVEKYPYPQRSSITEVKFLGFILTKVSTFPWKIKKFSKFKHRPELPISSRYLFSSTS
jgi:hypothetical protein